MGRDAAASQRGRPGPLLHELDAQFTNIVGVQPAVVGIDELQPPVGCVHAEAWNANGFLYFLFLIYFYFFIFSFRVVGADLQYV